MSSSPSLSHNLVKYISVTIFIPIRYFKYSYLKYWMVMKILTEIFVSRLRKIEARGVLSLFIFRYCNLPTALHIQWTRLGNKYRKNNNIPLKIIFTWTPEGKTTIMTKTSMTVKRDWRWLDLPGPQVSGGPVSGGITFDPYVPCGIKTISQLVKDTLLIQSKWHFSLSKHCAKLNNKLTCHMITREREFTGKNPTNKQIKFGRDFEGNGVHTFREEFMQEWVFTLVHRSGQVAEQKIVVFVDEAIHSIQHLE